MPRTNPLPTREKEIGRRLRQARELQKLTRVAMAAKLGIDSSRLASYEFGRAPVPYRIGDQVAREARVCQRWLATGEMPMDGYLAIYEGVASALPSSLPFSFVYDNALNPLIGKTLEMVARNSGVSEEELDFWELRHVDPIGIPSDLSGEYAMQEMLACLSLLVRSLPPPLRREFHESLMSTAERLMIKHKAARAAYAGAREKIAAEELAKTTEKMLTALEAARARTR